MSDSGIDSTNDKAALSWLNLESSTITSTLDVKQRQLVSGKIQSLLSNMPQDEVVEILGELCKTSTEN